MSPRPARKARRRRTLYAALAVVLFPAVLLLSFLPHSDKELLHTRGRFHSLGHLAVFGAVAFVAARTAHTPRARLLMFAVSLLFGFGIEVGEHMLFHAPVEWKDVVVDTAGVLAGTLLAMLSAPEEDLAEAD